MLLTLTLGALVGAVLGLTGAGGGILAIPALMASQGWSLPQAAPVALLAVVAGAALGAYEGWRRRQVRYRAALLMAVSGVPFTSLGIRLAHQVPAAWLSALFALIMLIVAARSWRAARAAPTAAAPHRDAVCQVNPDTGRLRWNPASLAALAGVGAFTGLLTGLLGVGGGFVIVPALRRLSDLGMHAIVATSLLVIALVGSGGVASALWHGARLPALPSMGFVLAAMAGMLLGRRLVHRLSPSQLLRGFAALVAAVSFSMLWHAATSLA
ncbi:sulfite exporter TauE/SafE family protein [Chromobacterium paludis]|uniref:Probable membrane transporter protein n=1 Tax=Chromobacterium paludis TaxID=2605945 RepID=A0A5C1DMF9_9NEIS|nr:sulfite exporter TauE/SafE family protein [Chromobacterium paludis]QEL57277.1 sulfite exporter TauE/SafE family protein [Chromobacterium paludis]